MKPQLSHEKSRLQEIEQKVQDVQEKLSSRLPAQYRHLVAMVCGTKWRLQTLKPQDTAAVVKKARLELGAFDYRVKEQAELLTRHLLELDGVLSHGDADIKSARKALVVFVQQQLLPQADAFKERSAKLKQFGEDALSGFEREPLEPSMPSDVESDDMHVKALFEESGEESSESKGEDEVAEDDEMDESTGAKQDEPMEPEAAADDEAEDEEGEQAAPWKLPRLQSAAAPQTPNADGIMLPVWQPYYQLQRRQDGIYLLARLNDIDPRNMRVQWNDRSGVLRVSGFRLPTQKDIVMSRLSGAPTFGRFEIAEQFPRNLLNVEEATQQVLEDGTLQIRMPYYVARRPLRYRPASLFQPQDCFVW